MRQAIEERIQSTPSSRELNPWIVLPPFVIMTYMVYLCCPEGFWIDLESFCTITGKEKRRIISSWLFEEKSKGAQCPLPSLALCFAPLERGSGSGNLWRVFDGFEGESRIDGRPCHLEGEWQLVLIQSNR
jgi:hypothetical protein